MGNIHVLILDKYFTFDPDTSTLLPAPGAAKEENRKEKKSADGRKSANNKTINHTETAESENDPADIIEKISAVIESETENANVRINPDDENRIKSVTVSTRFGTLEIDIPESFKDFPEESEALALNDYFIKAASSIRIITSI